VQREASEGFAAVGARAIKWLDSALNGCADVALVTWGGTNAKEGRAFEVLLLELARHKLELPRGRSYVGVDLLHAARQTQCYSKLGAAQWPPRVPPTAKQQRGGVLLALQYAATYELTVNSRLGGGAAAAAAPTGGQRVRRQRRGGGVDSSGLTWEAASDALAALCDHQPLAGATWLGVVVAALAPRLQRSSKEVIFFLSDCGRWAAAHSAYEAEVREDPVPGGWREPGTARGGEAPAGYADEDALRAAFKARPGCARFGGPSADLRAAAGTLAQPGRLELGRLTKLTGVRIPSALDSDDEGEGEDRVDDVMEESGEEEGGEEAGREESGAERSAEGCGGQLPCERPWQQLTKHEQVQATLLGFVDASWDGDVWDAVPHTWGALPRRERRAAVSLGFVEASWHGGGGNAVGCGLWLRGRFVGVAAYPKEKGRCTDVAFLLEGTRYRVLFSDGQHSWHHEDEIVKVYNGAPPSPLATPAPSTPPSPPLSPPPLTSAPLSMAHR